jgi:hypothetical protein
MFKLAKVQILKNIKKFDCQNRKTGGKKQERHKEENENKGRKNLTREPTQKTVQTTILGWPQNAPLWAECTRSR